MYEYNELVELLMLLSSFLVHLLHLFNPQADVKIPGLPLKVVMEAIQQATGEQNISPK